MKYEGRARRAGLKLILITLLLVLAFGIGGILATMVGTFMAALTPALFVVWLVFALFTLYFFRDPTPQGPSDSRAIVAPAYGKVDVIDEVDEPNVIGGRCKRVSIFLSVVDVHVQYAPISGKITYLKHTAGKFLNAMKAETCAYNENVLLGFEPVEFPEEKIAVRLLAGLIARRIVPYVAHGDLLQRGERISLIQFGSRCDLYLPMKCEVQVKLGDKVVGGETLVARYPSEK